MALPLIIFLIIAVLIGLGLTGWLLMMLNSLLGSLGIVGWFVVIIVGVLLLRKFTPASQFIDPILSKTFGAIKSLPSKWLMYGFLAVLVVMGMSFFTGTLSIADLDSNQYDKLILDENSGVVDFMVNINADPDLRDRCSGIIAYFYADDVLIEKEYFFVDQSVLRGGYSISKSFEIDDGVNFVTAKVRLGVIKEDDIQWYGSTPFNDPDGRIYRQGGWRYCEQDLIYELYSEIADDNKISFDYATSQYNGDWLLSDDPPLSDSFNKFGHTITEVVGNGEGGEEVNVELTESITSVPVRLIDQIKMFFEKIKSYF